MAEAALVLLLLALTGGSTAAMTRWFGAWLCVGIGAVAVMTLLALIHELLAWTSHDLGSGGIGVAALLFAASGAQTVPILGLFIGAWTRARPERARVGLALLAGWFGLSYAMLALGMVALSLMLLLRGVLPEWLVT